MEWEGAVNLKGRNESRGSCESKINDIVSISEDIRSKCIQTGEGEIMKELNEGGRCVRRASKRCCLAPLRTVAIEVTSNYVKLVGMRGRCANGVEVRLYFVHLCSCACWVYVYGPKQDRLRNINEHEFKPYNGGG